MVNNNCYSHAHDFSVNILDSLAIVNKADSSLFIIIVFNFICAWFYTFLSVICEYISGLFDEVKCFYNILYLLIYGQLLCQFKPFLLYTLL